MADLHHVGGVGIKFYTLFSFSSVAILQIFNFEGEISLNTILVR